MKPYSLVGELCELTPYEPADTQRVFDYCQDPEIQRWTTVPVPYRMEDAAVFTTSIAQKGWDGEIDEHERVWAIRTPGEGGKPYLAGSVGLRPDPPGRSVEIGYLVAADCRGRGLATDAVRTVVAHALGELGMRRVIWHAAVGNWPSRRLAVRCGFTIEGTIRSQLVQRGQALDAWVATILAADLAKQEGYFMADGRVRLWD
ncbi:MAG: GNAT family N-acetyltransferase [Bifidobacteriaceae bacterium]|jgi:RimJ/RimL family protein N-acetyltransferase|nr:GNAT family N-acetyltransferase [Bifidobacteriaceae bacterium]